MNDDSIFICNAGITLRRYVTEDGSAVNSCFTALPFRNKYSVRHDADGG